MAVDRAGNIYISDGSNHRIRMVNTAGIITTIAGTGTPGFSGDGGPASKARVNSPRGIAVDAAGNLYIADYSNQRIRVIAANGIISTIAGTGANGYAGDGGPASAARLSFPSGVAVDSAGNVYIADNQNSVIRKLTPSAGALPSISAGGVVGAASFGAFTSIAPGSWIEIYGSALAADSRGWANSDFSGSNAPTSLDGTSVFVGGQPAFVDYISANQVNAQVPSTVPTGTQSVSVTNTFGTSTLYSINVNATQPGLDAPPSLNVGGTQYVAAFFNDGSLVTPASPFPGTVSRQAKPGETITLYGVGFGPVTPSILAGQVVGQSNTLASTLQISLAQVPATLSYSGLAPGAVGLYQFNVVVPNIPNSDTVPVTFTLNGTPGSQKLYTAVHN